MSDVLSIFMCGDVMTGRGVDQVMSHPSNPRLFESWVQDASEYVYLAEKANGPIVKPISPSYVWGDTLSELKKRPSDIRMVNLETSVTTSDNYWVGKGINYRMHPANISCLTAAGINCCALANNHVLDWGYEGLDETIATLDESGIEHAGAGSDKKEAVKPASFNFGDKGRVLVMAFGDVSSGIPLDWAAGKHHPGVALLVNLSEATANKIGQYVATIKQPGDILIASIHWGSNWGYDIPHNHVEFAHALIDAAQVDLIHGHSSHHPLAIEVYRERLILYGCGDFVNDYEGIRGHENFRPDLSFMYFASLEPKRGTLQELELIPMQTKRFQLHHSSMADAIDLGDVVSRESRQFGSHFEINHDGVIQLCAA